MRTIPVRALGLIALLSLSSVAGAQQVGRRPRTGTTRPTPGAQPLPPQAPEVARDLALKRSRWSSEGYAFLDAIELPSAAGGAMARYTTGGAGTHAAYRYADHFSTTLDMTAAIFGGPANAYSVEAGQRWSPLDWSHQARPFIDLRGAYMRVNDTFYEGPAGVPDLGPGSGDAIVAGSRYSHGFGAVGGAGVELSITRSLALTTELTGMRGRMTTYRLNSSDASIPAGSTYWMSSVRYIVGFKFSPVRTQSVRGER